ncbi:MAG TPA: hypothetical protein VGI19_17540 [Candidatus Cybelea sp.]|jgi:hypothetical protein
MKHLSTILISSVLLTACNGLGAGTPVTTTRFPTAQAEHSFKIFVSNVGDGTITAYEPNGTETTPTIKTGGGSTDYLFAMAVGPTEKSTR